MKYETLKGASYIRLPCELRNSSKGLVSMKNNDDQCFRWCHSRHLNPQEKYRQWIEKLIKQHVEKLNYSAITLLGYLWNISIKSRNKITLILMYSITKKRNHFLFTYVKKNSMIRWICYCYQNYFLIKDFNKFMLNQSNDEHGKRFVHIVCSVSVVKISRKIIKLYDCQWIL